jgi:hypothetical protein
MDSMGFQNHALRLASLVYFPSVPIRSRLETMTKIFAESIKGRNSMLEVEMPIGRM